MDPLLLLLAAVFVAMVAYAIYDRRRRKLAPLEPPKPANLTLWPTTIGAAIVVLLDGVLLSQGAIAFVLGLWTVFIRIPMIVLAWGNRPLIVFRALKVAIYAIAVVLVTGWVYFNSQMADRRAHEMITAVDSYFTKHGRYPAKLDELVPEIMPSIPRAKWTLLFNDFQYHEIPGGKHYLVWTVMPPFGRRTYWFEDKRWGRVD